MTKPRPSIAWLLDTVALVALGVPILRYGLAFQAAEPPLNLWGLTVDVSPLTGLLFGLSYEAAVYLAMREAFRARRDGLKRWWLPLCGVALQVVAGVAIVAPVVEAQLTGQALPAVLGAWSWAWSIVLTGATLLTFASVALARALRKDGTVRTETQSDAIPDAIPAQPEVADGNGNGRGTGKEAAYQEWLHNRHLQLVSIAVIGGCSTSTASRWRKEWKKTLA